MKLLIAIPALNEENSIRSIIERCLEAKPYIIQNTVITDIEITVISDGSTDKTVEYAQLYKDQINLIIFKKNQGYGAAIKTAWSESDAELLSFLDADGTCDPKFFVELTNLIDKAKADVVLGGRIHKNSQMPLIRTVGNRIFALLLTIFSHKRIRDTASGMRIVRQSSLKDLYPLPDGLHFTPAMSARAILSNDLTILEENMPYKEREGQSKLHVIKDGLRFLKVIIETAFLYRPARLFGLMAIATGLASSIIMLVPLKFYLLNGRLLEWMQYRFFVFLLGATLTLLLLFSSFISKKIVWMSLSDADPDKTVPNLLSSIIKWKYYPFLPILSFFSGSALLWNSFMSLVHTGHTNEHWSRFIIMAFLYTVGSILVLAKVMDVVLDLIAARVRYLSVNRENGDVGKNSKIDLPPTHAQPHSNGHPA